MLCRPTGASLVAPAMRQQQQEVELLHLPRARASWVCFSLLDRSKLSSLREFTGSSETYGAKQKANLLWSSDEGAIVACRRSGRWQESVRLSDAKLLKPVLAVLPDSSACPFQPAFFWWKVARADGT